MSWEKFVDRYAATYTYRLMCLGYSEIRNYLNANLDKTIDLKLVSTLHVRTNKIL